MKPLEPIVWTQEVTAMRRVFVPASITAVLLAVLVGPAVPVAAQQEYPVTPDPAACQTEPRTADELLPLWYGPDGSPIAAPMDEAGAEEVALPLGPVADAATVAAIEATVIEVFSCFAGGDFLRASSLFTDNLVASFGPEFGAPVEDARAFLAATPEPEPDEGRILAITDVMDLGDGRVGAFVVEQTGDDPPLTSYGLFVEEEGRWLVDEIIEFSTPAFQEGEEESGATPVP